MIEPLHVDETNQKIKEEIIEPIEEEIIEPIEEEIIEPIPELIFIVPYRDRKQQQLFFNKQMKETVLEGMNNYKIFYIHQMDNRSFNRGAMKNIGFIYVKNTYPNDYKNITLVFNDIDVMPFTRGYFDYQTTFGVVKHFYGFNFALGGIFSIKAGDFEKTGGFPNFFSWGYEDNLMQYRVLKEGLIIDRKKKEEMYSKEVLHLLSGLMREVNRNEYELYRNETREGYNTIHHLHYQKISYIPTTNNQKTQKNIINSTNSTKEITEIQIHHQKTQITKNIINSTNSTKEITEIQIHQFNIGREEALEYRTEYDLRKGNKVFNNSNQILKRNLYSMKMFFNHK